MVALAASEPVEVDEGMFPDFEDRELLEPIETRELSLFLSLSLTDELAVIGLIGMSGTAGRFSASSLTGTLAGLGGRRSSSSVSHCPQHHYELLTSRDVDALCLASTAGRDRPDPRLVSRSGRLAAWTQVENSLSVLSLLGRRLRSFWTGWDDRRHPALLIDNRDRAARDGPWHAGCGSGPRSICLWALVGLKGGKCPLRRVVSGNAVHPVGQAQPESLYFK